MDKINTVLSFNGNLQVLYQHCQAADTGTFLVVTNQNQALRFFLNKGRIVTIVYGVDRILATNLTKLLLIKSGRHMFSTRSQPSLNKSILPENAQIFAMLGWTAIKEKPQRTILVVEDSGTQRKIICKMLASDNYHTEQAINGLDALSKLATNQSQFDLILLDIIMPDFDGYKVMKAIKNNDKLNKIPVVFLTSRDSLFDKYKGKRSDACDYLTKPFSKDTLLATVKKHLPAEAS